MRMPKANQTFLENPEINLVDVPLPLSRFVPQGWNFSNMEVSDVSKAASQFCSGMCCDVPATFRGYDLFSTGGGWRWIRNDIHTDQ
jgi:hypothetical protein